MRKVISILLIVVWSVGSLYAQDQQRLSEREIDGTARYVGMCGAMTAIGGDPSAVIDNPAGLGVYRRMEIMLSLDNRYTLMEQPTINRLGSNQFSMPQVSLVLHFPNFRQSNAMVANNLFFGYQRLRSFNCEYASSMKNQSASLANVICMKTNGYSAQQITEGDFWDDPELGWLSCQGWNTYLINPKSETSKEWVSALQKGETVDQSLQISESGYIDQYSLDWAMNISDKLYVGLGFQLNSLSWIKNARYIENFQKGGGLDSYSSVYVDGITVSGVVGLIYHPIEWWRIGTSFQTPSAGSIHCNTYGDLTVSLDSTRTSATPTFYEDISGFHFPMRLSTGTALQIPQFGLLSLQYDYAHYKDRMDTHSLKVGVEIAPYKGLYINAGYAYESSFANTIVATPIAYNSARTDTDDLRLEKQQYASLGIGYRGRSMIWQVAYQYGWSDNLLFAHELTDAAMLHSQTHRIVMSIGWHSR